jgi:hypothetical protein
MVDGLVQISHRQSEAGAMDGDGSWQAAEGLLIRHDRRR